MNLYKSAPTIETNRLFIRVVSSEDYKDYYRLPHTTALKHFRPFSKTDDSIVESIFLFDTTHCFGTYAITGRLWY